VVSAAGSRFFLLENIVKMQIPRIMRKTKVATIPIPAFSPVLNPSLVELLELLEALVGWGVKVTVVVTCGGTLETVCKRFKSEPEFVEIASLELVEGTCELTEGDAEAEGF
jgi:hypothetical protein